MIGDSEKITEISKSVKDLLRIAKYKNSIKNEEHSKIQAKLRRLFNQSSSKEICLERKYLHKRTRENVEEIGKLVMADKTVLLRREAGAGKSSCLAKSVTLWDHGQLLENILCVLFLTAGSDEIIALSKLLWMDYPEAGKWSLEHACRLPTSPIPC